MILRIQDERKKRRWSQDYVANMLGSSADRISRMEHGKPIKFTPEEIIALETLFELPVKELFSEVGRSKCKTTNVLRVRKTNTEYRTPLGKLGYVISGKFPSDDNLAKIYKRFEVDLYTNTVTIKIFRYNGRVTEYPSVSVNSGYESALQTVAYLVQADLGGLYDIECKIKLYTETKSTKSGDIPELPEVMTLRDIFEGIPHIYGEVE